MKIDEFVDWLHATDGAMAIVKEWAACYAAEGRGDKYRGGFGVKAYAAAEEISRA